MNKELVNNEMNRLFQNIKLVFKLKKYFSFILISLCISSCRYNRTIAYYNLNASKLEYKNSINKIWDSNPENIIKYEELIKYVDSYKNYPSMYSSIIQRLGIDSLPQNATESIFFFDEYAVKPYTDSWILKTSDNFMWCKIWIVNCDINCNNCSICLQMFLIPEQEYKWKTDFKNNKRNNIMKRFEQDILSKIIFNINEQRK